MENFFRTTNATVIIPTGNTVAGGNRHSVCYTRDTATSIPVSRKIHRKERHRTQREVSLLFLGRNSRGQELRSGAGSENRPGQGSGSERIKKLIGSCNCR